MTPVNSETDELPLFPLPQVVLFPGGVLPLHIFEMRYREMIRACLKSKKRFGLLCVDSSGRPASIGCCADIIEVEKLPDGRMNILTVGSRRFRVVDFKHDHPYLTGVVEWIEDSDPESDLSYLACEMEQLLRDVAMLSAKLAGKDFEFPEDLPREAKDLSYWVAGSIPGLPKEQQALLEMQDTAARLQRETEILTSARKHLAARTALKDVFSKT